MTKGVLISISGLHFNMEESGETDQPIEVITPASYYNKNGKHYVIYDEVIEGIPGTVKNQVKITGDSIFEIRKSGIASAHMVFEKGRMTVTSYSTPYGEMMIGIHTRDIRIEESEDLIEARIWYELDVNSEPLAECEIEVKIKGVAARQ